MPWFVYIPRSEKNGRTCVGCAGDVQTRLARHNAGQVAAARTGRPWRILHVEEVANYPAARDRERYLKSGSGRRWMANHLFPDSNRPLARLDAGIEAWPRPG